MRVVHKAKSSSSGVSDERALSKAVAELTRFGMGQGAVKSSLGRGGKSKPKSKLPKKAAPPNPVSFFNVSQPRSRAFAVGMPASTDTKLTPVQLALIAKEFRGL